MANDEDCFATNAYNRNNLYSDLTTGKAEEKSDWAQFEEAAAADK